ncbi:response regulator [Paenibacillus sp. J22TS3]|uniref:response regulator n=1 Tax=Paenibacillus sp. J22TS3 TaxID=2807192 RepID=UPI001B18AE4F|nr:response regulator [Paenibacillus sp. J22TS3]GIP19755.1 AraC family transcriptional regulator [Paenibacillus sp. J22TS3]
MKVLIADDEKLSRAFLISMLEEAGRGISIAGEAANGEELLEALIRLQPDVAFVDIRMPRMNGLEAIERGRKLSPHTEWVILSGYSEFEYARQAISLGASKYLLKPLGLEELEEVLDELFIRMEQTSRRLDEEFGHQLLSTIRSGPPAITEGLGQNAEEEGCLYRGLLAVADTGAPAVDKERIMRQLSEVLRDTARGKSGHAQRIAVIPLATGQIAAVVLRPAGVSAEDPRMDGWAESLYTRVQLLSDSRTVYTQIDGGLCASRTELLKQLADMHRLSSLRAVMGVGRKLPLDELRRQPDQTVRLGQVLTQLADDYHRRQYMDYCRELEELTVLLRTNAYPPDTEKNIRQYIRYGIHEGNAGEREDLKDINGLKTLLTRYADKLLADKNKAKGEPADMIAEAIHYIERHYASDVTIAQLAEKLGITPNYLSTAFHKKTGSTFTKYLTRLRIHRAKELLSTTSLSVKDVALQVGYYSTRHFVKLFSEYEGCYPTEYKKQRRLAEER